jgi:hypothetical protein
MKYISLYKRDDEQTGSVIAATAGSHPLRWQPAPHHLTETTT